MTQCYVLETQIFHTHTPFVALFAKNENLLPLTNTHTYPNKKKTPRLIITLSHKDNAQQFIQRNVNNLVYIRIFTLLNSLTIACKDGCVNGILNTTLPRS